MFTPTLTTPLWGTPPCPLQDSSQCTQTEFMHSALVRNSFEPKSEADELRSSHHLLLSYLLQRKSWFWRGLPRIWWRRAGLTTRIYIRMMEKHVRRKTNGWRTNGKCSFVSVHVRFVKRERYLVEGMNRCCECVWWWRLLTSALILSIFSFLLNVSSLWQ